MRSLVARASVKGYGDLIGPVYDLDSTMKLLKVTSRAAISKQVKHHKLLRLTIENSESIFLYFSSRAELYGEIYNRCCEPWRRRLIRYCPVVQHTTRRGNPLDLLDQGRLDTVLTEARALEAGWQTV